MEALKANIEKSNAVFEQTRHLLQPGACYNNVFSALPILKGMFPDKNIKVAYGYLGKEKLFYVRHCYFTVSGEIVDPTAFLYESLDKEKSLYLTFAELELSEYFAALYKSKGKADLGKVLSNKEKEFINVIVENNILIVEDDYDTFLKKHDKNNNVRVMPNLMRKMQLKKTGR